MTRRWRLALCGVAVACAATGMASAQTPQPGVIVGGSSEVSIGGLPAARAGDPTQTGRPIEQGSSNVFINGRPAATAGDRTGCGVVVRGANNVFINGKPAARAGDVTSGC